MADIFDVLVLGLGPAGRAAASACAAAGLVVAGMDPAPDRRWTATYGAWSDELDAGVPVAVQLDAPGAWTTRRHTLGRAYSVLDTVRLQASLSLEGVEVRRARAVDVAARVVTTSDGHQVQARLVLDARGAAVAGRVQQVAHGVVVDRAVAEPVLDGAQALFMDWRQPPEVDPRAAPTFLYVLPLDADRVLLEETCLAGRPAPSGAELRRRLVRRLQVHGMGLRGDEPVEHVRFALDTPLPAVEWRGGVPAAPRLGAAAPLVHPATGYSVATSLALARHIALAAQAADPARAVQRLLWPPSARAVHALRRHGLRVVLGLSPAQVPELFAAFLDLPVHHQRAYLSERTSPVGVAAAMTALLPDLSWPVRRGLVGTLRR